MSGIKLRVGRKFYENRYWDDEDRQPITAKFKGERGIVTQVHPAGKGFGVQVHMLFGERFDQDLLVPLKDLVRG